MIRIIYLVILSYFILGGFGFYLINRKKDKQTARKSYTKFISYFVIINILFFAITTQPIYFRWLSAIIIGVGLIELIRLYLKSKYQHTLFFTLSIILYILLTYGFVHFSMLSSHLILFSFLILSIFDSFSQITGQLWGKKKLFPKISPQKTIGGLAGGAIIAIASAFLLDNLCGMMSKIQIIILSAGIILFAFGGDLAASWYKRKYNVKDYDNLIPGHGGFLDRFDSLIGGGAWVALWVFIINL